MLMSAEEDFSVNTLSALPRTLSRLRYLAGLRQDDGEYFHWGMARVHGETSANVAIAQAHSQVFRELLRKPVSSLWDELCMIALEEDSDVQTLINTLLERKKLLAPAETLGGSTLHLSSILTGLSFLAASWGAKTGQAA